jgi:hypothetical protein
MMIAPARKKAGGGKPNKPESEASGEA